MTPDGWEIGLFLLALVSLALAVWNLRDALKDQRALRAAGVNGDKALIADSHARTGALRLLQQLGFVAFAVALALDIATIVILYGVVALPILGAWFDLQTRRRLLKR